MAPTEKRTKSTAPSPTKKAKINKNDTDALVKLVQEGIENTTSPEEAEELHLELKKLAEAAKDKKFDLKKGSNDFRDGCLVELIESKQGITDDYNIPGTETSAKFTAGPKRTPFSIHILYFNGFEGEYSIHMKSKLFRAEEGENDNFDEIKQKDINAFLKKAGFGLKPVTRLTADGKVTDAKMLKRFAYAEVINEALELLGDKHEWDEYPGEKLELGNDSIYPLMGLGHWKHWKENERELPGGFTSYTPMRQLVLVSGAVLPPRGPRGNDESDNDQDNDESDEDEDEDESE